MVWHAPQQYHLALSQPSKVLSGWESLTPEFLEQHVARESFRFLPKTVHVFWWFSTAVLVLKLLQWGNDEKCDETSIAAFGRAGGLGRKSHPTWTLRVCALRGPHPAESRRRRPREFPVQVYR